MDTSIWRVNGDEITFWYSLLIQKVFFAKDAIIFSIETQLERTTMRSVAQGFQ